MTEPTRIGPSEDDFARMTEEQIEEAARKVMASLPAETPSGPAPLSAVISPEASQIIVRYRQAVIDTFKTTYSDTLRESATVDRLKTARADLDSYILSLESRIDYWRRSWHELQEKFIDRTSRLQSENASLESRLAAVSVPAPQCPVRYSGDLKCDRAQCLLTEGHDGAHVTHGFLFSSDFKTPDPNAAASASLSTPGCADTQEKA